VRTASGTVPGPAAPGPGRSSERHDRTRDRHRDPPLPSQVDAGRRTARGRGYAGRPGGRPRGRRDRPADWPGRDRDVRLSAERPEGATIERPSPEDVIDHGEDADGPYAMLQLGAGTPGRNFVDFAPVRLVTAATLDRRLPGRLRRGGTSESSSGPSSWSLAGARPLLGNDTATRERGGGELLHECCARSGVPGHPQPDRP
jgi:hypothetical protein